MTAYRSLARRLAPAFFVILAAFVAPAAHADGLDTVMSSHTLRVAVVEDYPPFGSVGSDMKPVGYDIELASMLAKFMGVKVELVVVNSANKIPYLLTRHADVLLNIGKNAERQKVVDFSEPYAPYYIGVFGPADIKVGAVADLAGKSVATTRGSFEELILSKNAPPGTDVRRFEDNATTISAFMSGQTQLIAMGNIVAAALLAKNPDRRPEQKLLLLNSPVCAAVLKGENRLLAKTNEAIAQAKKDGALAAMALHWLKQPLPESF
jgi:polar amino acid transport system substrate-binding protein